MSEVDVLVIECDQLLIRIPVTQATQGSYVCEHAVPWATQLVGGLKQSFDLIVVVNIGLCHAVRGRATTPWAELQCADRSHYR